MNTIVGVFHALSPDAQIILMMSLFALILLIATSRSATQNLRDFLNAVGDIFRKPKS